MLRFVILILLTASYMSCATQKQYTLDTLPEERMEFAFGGGFTGEYKEYLLLENGQLYYRKKVVNELPWRAYEPVDSKIAKELFATYEKQKLAELNYNDPGNMTYTITSFQGGDSTTITWGGIAQKPSEELKTYWRRVMATVSDKDPLPQVE